MVDEAERLRRRYQRERAARAEAEQIAERAIADLTQANTELDRRVADRTTDLEAALARVEAADAAKSTFVRGLAHEMSTPLHAIRGLVELVQSRTDDLEIRGSAQQAREAAERLNQALRTLLEFAAVSSGDVSASLETMRLGDYADLLADRWRLLAARKGLLLVVEVAPDPHLTMKADPARLDQIVDALVDNAVRFGAGQVRVDLVHLEGASPSLRIVVTDEGPGVPVELGAQVFESFVRGEGPTEGFGVGLTLARAVAEALGGTLDLEPREVGARFVAELPVG